MNRSIRAVGWNTKDGTDDILMIPIVGRGRGGGDGIDAVLTTKEITSSPGISCNQYEQNALIRIIQYHDEYHDNIMIGGGGGGANNNDDPCSTMKQLSKSYRGALRDCLAAWESSKTETDGEGDNEGDGDDVDNYNLFLMKGLYDFMHLSDIFIPLLMEENYFGGGGGYSSFELQQKDPYDVPGIVAADTVRYLRYNLLMDINELYPSSPQTASGGAYDEIMKANYPEQLFGSEDGGNVYWKIIVTLVLRGCLEQGNVIMMTNVNTAHSYLY